MLLTCVFPRYMQANIAQDREHNFVCTCSSPALLGDRESENHKWSGGLLVVEGD